MNGTEEKRQCVAKTIGTHDGTFHCDEVLACWMLRQLPEYHNNDIVRTRNPEKLSGCDIVVDVGAVYDPAVHRYDHHQREFTGTMQSLGGGKWVTKLSSAGLVYLHFGKQLMQELCKTKDESTITILYNKMYESFVEEVDAVDNGISQCDGEHRYRVTTQLGSRVAGLNPAWNSEDKDPQPRFEKAMQMVGTEFSDRLAYFKDSWLSARDLVEKAVKERHEVDPSGEIVLLKDGGCPWKEHLMQIEEEQNLQPTIKFMLFTDQSGKYRVQTIPDRIGSFGFRVGLLEQWRGIRDAELSKLSGIEGCIFVHTAGFIGGNATYDGALQMARESLKAHHASAMES